MGRGVSGRRGSDPATEVGVPKKRVQECYLHFFFLFSSDNTFHWGCGSVQGTHHLGRSSAAGVESFPPRLLLLMEAERLHSQLPLQRGTKAGAGPGAWPRSLAPQSVSLGSCHRESEALVYAVPEHTSKCFSLHNFFPCLVSKPALSWEDNPLAHAL